MRLLSVVVVAESVVLAALSWSWLFSGTTGAAARATSGPAPAPSDPASLRAAGGPAPAGTRDTSPVRTALADPAPAAAVLVHGRLLAADGGAPPTDASVSFRAGKAWRAATTNADRFAVPGLAPGTWTLRVTADGFASHEAECTLEQDALQTMDVSLRRAQCVKVFLHTPDGGSLAAALAKVGVWQGLTVVATATALDRDLPATENSSVGDLDGGRYRSKQDRNASQAADVPDGELQLDQAPVHAALLLRHVVLAQQLVAPAQDTLTFTIDPATMLAKLATVRLRLVDADSREPLSGMVTIETAQGGGARGKTDAEGRLVIEHVLPGTGALQARPKEHEALWTIVRIPSGGEVDLGEIAVHRTVPLSGRVLDALHQPVSGTVQWTPLDTMTFPRLLVDRRSTTVDGDGEFRLQVGRRRYVVIAHGSDGSIGYATGEGGSSEVCEIRVTPAVTIRVVARGDRYASYVATVRDAAGVPIAARAVEPRWREQMLTVPAGDYTLEVHDQDDRLVLSRKLVAGHGDVEVEVGR